MFNPYLVPMNNAGSAKRQAQDCMDGWCRRLDRIWYWNRHSVQQLTEGHENNRQWCSRPLDRGLLEARQGSVQENYRYCWVWMCFDRWNVIRTTRLVARTKETTSWTFLTSVWRWRTWKRKNQMSTTRLDSSMSPIPRYSSRLPAFTSKTEVTRQQMYLSSRVD